MFNENGWRPTDAAKAGQEDFYPNSHVRWDEWGDGNYPSVPDYQILEVKQTDRASFQPTKLFHVTNYEGAKAIVTDRAFRSKNKKRIGKVEGHFSWWSFQIDEGEKERENNKYQEIIKQNPEIKDTLLEFFNSPAFEDKSRYGNFQFTYDIQTLIETYKRSVCDGKQPEFRVLGTFRYKQEIMHAVVVLPPVVSLFEVCLHVPNDPNAAVSVSDQGWKWRPDSTGNTKPRYRRWDHVSFAFYLPSEEQQINLPDGDPPLTYCKTGEINLSGSDPLTEKDFKKYFEELTKICNNPGMSPKK